MRYYVICSVDESSISSGEFAEQIENFSRVIDGVTDLDALYVEFRDNITEDRAIDYSVTAGEIWTVAAYPLVDQSDFVRDGIKETQNGMKFSQTAEFSKTFTL